jgi:hypothetical protein
MSHQDKSLAVSSAVSRTVQSEREKQLRVFVRPHVRENREARPIFDKEDYLVVYIPPSINQIT